MGYLRPYVGKIPLQVDRQEKISNRQPHTLITPRFGPPKGLPSGGKDEQPRDVLGCDSVLGHGRQRRRHGGRGRAGAEKDYQRGGGRDKFLLLEPQRYDYCMLGTPAEELFLVCMLQAFTRVMFGAGASPG